MPASDEKFDLYHTRRRLSGLLSRLRHTVPCPLAPSDLYAQVLPDGRLLEALTAKEAVSLAVRNLQKSLTYRDSMNIHIRVADIELCMRLSEPMPAPRGVADPFEIWPAKDMLKQLQDWHRVASELDEYISGTVTQIYKVLPTTAKPAEVAVAWPEVVAAVPYLVPPSACFGIAGKSPRCAKLRAHVRKVFPPEQMDKLTSSLATAIMLPEDAETPPNVWLV